jgi:hypothetical protein
MAASRVEMFKPFSINAEEIQNLIDDHLLPPQAVLQWHPVKGEEIPIPNTNEILVSKAFF